MLPREALELIFSNSETCLSEFELFEVIESKLLQLQDEFAPADVQTSPRVTASSNAVNEESKQIDTSARQSSNTLQPPSEQAMNNGQGRI